MLVIAGGIVLAYLLLFTRAWPFVLGGIALFVVGDLLF